MTKINDGGQAFTPPTPNAPTGISMRDYFAALAMQGICASGPGVHMTNPVIAREAYDLADAMLAERLKGQP